MEVDALSKVAITGDLTGRQAVYIETVSTRNIERKDTLLFEEEPSWMDDIVQYLQGAFTPSNTRHAR